MRDADHLRFRLRPAPELRETVVLSTAAADPRRTPTIKGPDLEQYAMPTLRGAAFTGDFEGTVSFGLALSHLKDFRVFELHAPNRLVIDLHH